jgi:hypothetical protein
MLDLPRIDPNNQEQMAIAYAAWGPATTYPCPNSLTTTSATPGSLSVAEVANRGTEFNGDLMATVLAMEVKQIGENAQQTLKQLDQTKRLRESIQNRVNDLNALLSVVRPYCDNEGKLKTDAKETASLAIDLRNLLDRNSSLSAQCPQLTTCNGSNVAERLSNCALLQKVEYQQDPATGKVSTVIVGKVIEGSRFNLDSLQAEVERLKGDIQSLESSRELTVMNLQQQVQEKQRIITLASNIADANHQGQKAIIGNTRV